MRTRLQQALLFVTLLLTAARVTGAVTQDYSRPGPFSVAQRTVTVARPDSTTFGALLFYPALTARAGATPVLTGAPHPAICFGHGFLSPPTLYTVTMRHLASWGFVVIAPQSALELFPSHQAYADDMRYCLRWMRAASATVGGEWSGVISTNRWGVSGHSMGGGASLLAAADDPEIDAVANMAAAETRPSAVAAMRRIHVPVCLLAGSEDRIAPPSQHSHRMYDQANAPRQFPLILGGSHCGFVDVPLPEAVCDEGSLPRPQQLGLARQQLTAFFLLYLKDDLSAWPFVWGPTLMLDPRIQVEADSGFELAPAYQKQRLPAGGSAVLPITLHNFSGATTRFCFAASGNTNGLFIDPPITAPLAPGATASLKVHLRLPAGIRRTFTLITSWPETDARTRDYLFIGLERQRQP